MVISTTSEMEYAHQLVTHCKRKLSHIVLEQPLFVLHSQGAAASACQPRPCMASTAARALLVDQHQLSRGSQSVLNVGICCSCNIPDRGFPLHTCWSHARGLPSSPDCHVDNWLTNLHTGVTTYVLCCRDVSKTQDFDEDTVEDMKVEILAAVASLDRGLAANVSPTH